MPEEAATYLPFGLPPIFPELSEQLETYLTQPERFPIHNSEKAIRLVGLSTIYTIDFQICF
jgi:hypothetical protein